MLTFVLCLWSLVAGLWSPAFAYTPTQEEKKFLLQVEQDTSKYFTRFADPKTGLVRDSSRPGSPCSIASTGFALVSWSIAKEHGWMTYKDSYLLTLRCLKTLRDKVEHKNGFFYHMVSVNTGKRVWSSEASSIDTALLLAGALYAGQVYKGTEVERIASELYRRVNWKWMTNNTLLLCHGWKPEGGFLPYYWDMYSEHLILQALAIGSPTHPISKQAWNEWNREEGEYNGKKVVNSFTGSLFTYQFSHAFIDFRNLWDRDINYFDNSQNATLTNLDFCLSNQSIYKSYSPENWGLSACLGPKGYKAYGALPGQAINDGTIAVHAAAGSIPFAPEITIKTLMSFYTLHKNNLYSPFGFKDSFNLEIDWWAQEELGVDQGITLLMIENFLSETIWKRFMKLEYIQKWIALCDLNRAVPVTRNTASTTIHPISVS
ncbi:MAG: hypothetical protein HZC17_09895 [Candidatus Omnitrophica bacterium]|nr:hypothetical protein [Candidatus Omnitrophota bacterium]